MTSDFESDLARIPDPFAQTANRALPRVPARPAKPSLTRARRRALSAGCVFAAVLYEAVGLLLFKTRPDLATTGGGSLALELALPLTACALAFAAVAARGRLGLGEATARLVAQTMGAPLFFAVVTLMAWPHDAGGAAFWSQTCHCFLATALLTAGPITLGALALRHSFVTAAGWRAAALGVASGALATATMALVCPNGNAFHLLVGHGSLMVVSAAGAAWLGRRLLSA